MALFALLSLLSTLSLAADSDGDGVDAATDCDDSDASVYRTESSSRSYTVKSDAEAAAFCTGYCSRKVSWLNMYGLTTTDGLQCVTGVTALNVISSKLTTMSGLSGLKSAKYMFISESGLTDFRGLEGLTDLDNICIGCGGDTPDFASKSRTELYNEMSDFVENSSCDYAVEDEANADLTSLDGLEGITALDTLSICGTASLTDMSGLHNLGSAGTILLWSNSALSSLRGLDNLLDVDLFVDYDSPELTSLDGLGGLTSPGKIYIAANYGLTSLHGLDNVTSMDTLGLISNSKLKDLSGLGSLTTLSSLMLSSNPMMGDLSGIDSLSALGSLTVRGLGALTSLTGLEGLTALPTMSIGCLLSNEPFMWRGCKPMGSLASLSALSGATGRLGVSLVQTPALTSLEGLEGATVMTELTLSETGVSDLTALSGVTAIGDLNIGCHKMYDYYETDMERGYMKRACHGADSLESLDGLENVTSVSSLTIVGNDALSDVSALGSVSSLYSIEVAENPYLEDLSTIGAPISSSPYPSTGTSVRVGCFLSSTYKNEYDAYADYTCSTASATRSLPNLAMSRLYEVELNDLPLLTSLDAFSDATSITRMGISGVGAADLTGLEGVTSIDTLEVGCNYVSASVSSPTWRCVMGSGPTSLDGLEGLRTIRTLAVYHNSALEDIEALRSVTSAKDISIVGNRSLSTADILSVLADIDSVTGTKKIIGNAP